MISTICTECGHHMTVPDHYIGRSVTCTSCSRPFVARMHAQARHAFTQAEQQRSRREALPAIYDFLAATSDQHYFDLDLESRNTMEAAVQELFANGFSTWTDLELSIIRLASSIPGRVEFLAPLHPQRIEALLAQSIAATLELQRTVAEAASLIASGLEGIRIGTTASGLVAARALGEQLADDLSQ